MIGDAEYIQINFLLDFGVVFGYLIKGTNFCGFCGFWAQNNVPVKLFKCEKQRSNNSHKGSNFLSSEKSAILSSPKKSQKYEHHHQYLVAFSVLDFHH